MMTRKLRERSVEKNTNEIFSSTMKGKAKFFHWYECWTEINQNGLQINWLTKEHSK